MTDAKFRLPELPPGRPAPRHSAARRLVLGVATALVVATGAGVAAAGSSPGVAPGAPAQPSPGATATPGGGYQTFTTQTGTVTSVQQNSISVRGDEGSSRTYAVNDSTRICAGVDGLSGIRTGDKVWVIGSAQGDQPVAFLVMDLTRPLWPGHPRGTASPGPTGPESPVPTQGSPYSPGATPGETASPETVEPTD